MQRGSYVSGGLPRCPECHGKLFWDMPSLRFMSRCEKCMSIQKILRCHEDGCEFQKGVCVTCRENSSERECSKINSGKTKNSAENVSNCNWILPVTLIVGFIFLILWVFCSNNSGMTETINASGVLEKFRKGYPLQRNDTWYHILSVLEKKIPAVKSITLLHGEETATSECLVAELVSLFSGGKHLQREEITFSSVGFEGVDYGLALEHYKIILKKFRVFVAHLNGVPGNVARIFHSLCDEGSSEIKPSLFVFLLKYTKGTEHLKPLERATAILKDVWQDLPDNELFPLLSRVLKNVVDIVPEGQSSC